MSRYYGILSGSAKTEATRRGTTKTGISATVQTWQGKVHIYLEPSDPSEKRHPDETSEVEIVQEDNTGKRTTLHRFTLPG